MKSQSSLDRWHSYGLFIQQVAHGLPSVHRAPEYINPFDSIRRMNKNQLKNLGRMLSCTINNGNGDNVMLSQLTYVNNRLRLMHS